MSFCSDQHRLWQNALHFVSHWFPTRRWRTLGIGLLSGVALRSRPLSLRLTPSGLEFPKTHGCVFLSLAASFTRLSMAHSVSAVCDVLRKGNATADGGAQDNDAAADALWAELDACERFPFTPSILQHVLKVGKTSPPGKSPFDPSRGVNGKC